MHLAAENRGKGVLYRVWAPEVYHDATNALSCKSKSVDNDSRAADIDSGSPAPNLLDCIPSVSEGNLISAEEIGEREIDAGHEDVNADEALNRPMNPEETLPEPGVSSVDLQLALVVSSDDRTTVSSETALSTSQKSPKSGLSQRYLCFSPTADAMQRQQRILDRVQVVASLHFILLLFSPFFVLLLSSM